MKRVIIAVTILLWPYSDLTAQAENWRGILLLKSTCKEVKSALKVDKCKIPMSEYDMPDYKIIVFFSESKRCVTPEDWRVTAGTATGLVILPKREMLPSELGINLSDFVKLGEQDVVGVEGYENREAGIKVSLFHGFVSEAHFFPAAKNERLRCKRHGQRLRPRARPLHPRN
jgi:hypothetical protein